MMTGLDTRWLLAAGVVIYGVTLLIARDSELATGAVVVIEFALALWLLYQNWREIRFLERIRPRMDTTDHPLFDALLNRARFLTTAGVYLIALTLVGVVLAASALPQVAQVFPPIRAINGAIFLALIAGPRYIGQAMRRLAHDV